MPTIYDDLEQAWKREVHSSDLQPLRPGFFKDLSAYTRRLREASRNVDSKSLKAAIIEDELQRIEQLLSSLLDRRLDKLWSRKDLDQSNGLDQAEKRSSKALEEVTRDYERLKQDLTQGKDPSAPRPREGIYVLVRFVRDVPSIIGVDLKSYGPFRTEDIARLPRENASSLVRQSSAVEVRSFDEGNG